MAVLGFGSFAVGLFAASAPVVYTILLPCAQKSYTPKVLGCPWQLFSGATGLRGQDDPNKSPVGLQDCDLLRPVQNTKPL